MTPHPLSKFIVFACTACTLAWSASAAGSEETAPYAPECPNGKIYCAGTDVHTRGKIWECTGFGLVRNQYRLCHGKCCNHFSGGANCCNFDACCNWVLSGSPADARLDQEVA